MYEIRVVAPMFPCWVATHKREVEVCVVTVSITFPATEGKGEKNNPTTQIRLLLLLLFSHATKVLKTLGECWCSWCATAAATE
jgi:hypothetical protein